MTAEGHLLGVIEALVAENQHAVAVDRRMDRADLVIGERAGQVDPVHHGGEIGPGPLSIASAYGAVVRPAGGLSLLASWFVLRGGVYARGYVLPAGLATGWRERRASTTGPARARAGRAGPAEVSLGPAEDVHKEQELKRPF